MDCDISCGMKAAEGYIGGLEVKSESFLAARRRSGHGPRRFQELQDSLKGIAPTTLSERLRTLEENGVVERRFYSMSPPRAEYVLTAKGRDLGPIVCAMRDWGRKVHASLLSVSGLHGGCCKSPRLNRVQCSPSALRPP
jgi:DNA-binding HxlR family transcriptional regulator